MLIERGAIWNGPSFHLITMASTQLGEFLHERQCENSFNVPSFHFSQRERGRTSLISRQVSRVFSTVENGKFKEGFVSFLSFFFFSTEKTIDWIVKEIKAP